MNRHFLLVTFGRVAQMVVMLVTYRVLSTLFSVSDMGLYYFLLSIASAFGLIYANPIGMYTNRVLHTWRDTNALMKNLNLVLAVFLMGSLLTPIGLLFIKDKVLMGDLSLTLILSTLVFYVFSTSINGTLVPALNLLGHTTQFVAWTFFYFIY